jgi:hypothetical protein
MAMPLIARLSASLPLAVKTMPSGSQPSSAATCARARSTASWAALPYSCALDGLPNSSSKYGRIASRTSGAIGVVAL